MFAAGKLSFESDKEMMQYALKTLTANEQPCSLVCKRDCFIVTRANLKQMNRGDLIKNVLENADDFCCSFGRNLSEEEHAQFAHNEAMKGIAVDFKAAQLFFNLVRQTKGVHGCQNFVTELSDKLA